MSVSRLTTVFERAKHLSQSVTQRPKRGCVDAIAGSRSIHFTGDQARVPEDLEVLRNRCLGQGQYVDDFTANADASLRKSLQYGQPGWVGQCFAGSGQALKICEVMLCIHVFIVYRRLTIVKPGFVFELGMWFILRGMRFLKNKHVVVAMLVAPVLAILGYFTLDALVGEKPKPALVGQSYPLAEKPNCRYASGLCELKNGEFELRLGTRTLGADRVALTLQSVVPLEGVMVALIEDAGGDAPPAPMEPLGPDGLAWSLEMPRPDAERHRLRLAASSGGVLYYGDAATEFTLLENPPAWND
jgi:hypothetical protein